MRKWIVSFAVAATFLVACNGSADSTFPEALNGTWSGQGGVSRLEFSNGGRVSITFSDNTRCSGSYSWGNYADREGTITITLGTYGCPKDSGGFARKTIALTEGGQLQMATASGPPLSQMLGGTYSRQ